MVKQAEIEVSRMHTSGNRSSNGDQGSFGDGLGGFVIATNLLCGSFDQDKTELRHCQMNSVTLSQKEDTL